MSLVATDAKEFNRPRLERTVYGDLARTGDGSVIVVDSKGFHTHIGCTLEFPDPETFERKFLEAFRHTSERFRVDLPRLFVSSRAVLEQVFKNDRSATLAFLYQILEEVKVSIGRAHVNWVILPPTRTPVVRTGGVESLSTEVPTREFVSVVGNMFPPISAWHYFRSTNQRMEEVRLDHFQGKTNRAWQELTAATDTMRVFPWGDECDPFICMADIFCYLTDKRLGYEHLDLRPENVPLAWRDLPFPVTGYYMDERFLSELRWTDPAPLRLHQYYPERMTYLMIDDDLLSEQTDTQDRVTLRAFLEGRGYIHAVVLHAQLGRTGFKVFHPDDWSEIRDQDHLVFMGPKSRARAQTISDAVSVTTESVSGLRERLRGKGFNC